MQQVVCKRNSVDINYNLKNIWNEKESVFSVVATNIFVLFFLVYYAVSHSLFP